jgi:hypothetical protein
LPQSMPAGAMVGRAVAPHRNTSANTRIVELVIANDRCGIWKAFSLYCAASKWGYCDACHPPLSYCTQHSSCRRQQQQQVAQRIHASSDQSLSQRVCGSGGPLLELLNRNSVDILSDQCWGGCYAETKNNFEKGTLRKTRGYTTHSQYSFYRSSSSSCVPRRGRRQFHGVRSSNMELITLVTCGHVHQPSLLSRGWLEQPLLF